MSSGWWIWMMFMFLFLVPPMGYGWGYRGWGPPYPRYLQRRRARQAAAAGGLASSDHEALGWAGDLVWGGLAIGTIWALCTLLWLT